MVLDNKQYFMLGLWGAACLFSGLSAHVPTELKVPGGMSFAISAQFLMNIVSWQGKRVFSTRWNTIQVSCC